MKKVLVAMSGGVDSSVTALLLQQQGFDVEGITMHLSRTVPQSESIIIQDAKKTADLLGIRHHVADLGEMFEREIIDYFVQSYQRGETPNPCVRCNEFMKFGYLLSEADRLGCGFFATGHYVRLQNGLIRRAADRTKDQSYFLYKLYNISIDRVLFPLGDLTKTDVKSIAERNNLPCAYRSESQDICFIPEGSYVEFLDSRITAPPAAGPIVNIEGNVIGRHDGIYKYTTGQRKGLGALGKRMFVKDIRPKDNTIVAAEDHELGVSHIKVYNMVRNDSISLSDESLTVQVRYRSAPVACKVKDINDQECTITFEQPVRAPSRGQSAVIYKDDLVVAGGIIA